jgi:hypothetical protein
MKKNIKQFEQRLEKDIQTTELQLAKLISIREDIFPLEKK